MDRSEKPVTVLQDKRNIMLSQKVRRCLFGKVNHNEIKNRLRQEMQEMYLESRSKWNYDFEKEEPVPGKYDWEPVKTDDVPSCYQKEYSTTKIRRLVPQDLKTPRENPYSARFNPLFSPRKSRVPERMSAYSEMKQLANQFRQIPLNDTNAASAAAQNSDTDSDSEMRSIFASGSTRKKETIPGKDSQHSAHTISRIFYKNPS